MKLRSLILSSLIVVLTETLALADAQCPGKITQPRYHALERSQIGVDVTINGHGPYEFLLDTGAQLTVIETSLAEELNLQPVGSIGVVAVANYSKAALVVPDSVQTGSLTVSRLIAAVQGLGQIQAVNPTLRGILGQNFLARFDLLIDHGRKMICLDDTRDLQDALKGERVELIRAGEQESDLPFTQPLLIRAHLPGDGAAGTILRVDSGSNAPLLFGKKIEILPWLQRTNARRAGVVNGSLSLAVMPSQNVKIGTRITRQIAFLTPINTGRKLAKAGEDGLLPTTLFRRVFISYRDSVAMFDPK